MDSGKARVLGPGGRPGIWSDGSGPDVLLYDLTFGGAVGRVAAGTLGQFDVYAATQTGVIR